MVAKDQDIADANRWVAERAAYHGLVAGARRISAEDPRIVFEAHRIEAGSPTYERAYSLFELERMGARALANEFLERARLEFPVKDPTADA